MLLVSVLALTSLYHVSTPRRGSWVRDIPGAVLAMTIWLLASYVVRASLEASLGGSTIYGPLSAPIVLLIWLYALAIAILIGSGLNAATRTIWPVVLSDGASSAVHWHPWSERAILPVTVEEERARPNGSPGEGARGEEARRRTSCGAADATSEAAGGAAWGWFCMSQIDPLMSTKHERGSYTAGVPADVAQLVERNLAKVEVAGSSPVVRSEAIVPLAFHGGVAERRGSGLQSRVHGFKSRLHLGRAPQQSHPGRLAQW